MSCRESSDALTHWLRKLALAFVAGIALGIVFFGGYWLGDHRTRSASAMVDDFGLLWQVRTLLTDRFIGEIPGMQAQTYGAVRGLVESFKDPYTVFVEPAPRRFERDEIRGHFGGIGAQIGRNDAGDVVLTVMRDRPAARAGVLDGDVLLAVDGKSIPREMSVQDIVGLIRGDEGAQVMLTLRRAGQADPFDISVVRERIETPSVEWRMLNVPDGIGYVKIGLFGERTNQELQTGLAELDAQGARKLIVDLRGNGGGLVDAAVDISSQFLSEGMVLRELKRGGQERYFPVKPVTSPAHKWPLVLLVDAGTASASEIVSGALRDAGRAILIGEKTYGKGSVQEVHELPDGSSLHVTVARWLTPARHQIDKVGLQPDVVVNITAADRDAGRDPQLAEAQAHLKKIQ
jgi:carboxyl-terminal processing protease